MCDSEAVVSSSDQQLNRTDNPGLDDLYPLPRPRWRSSCGLRFILMTNKLFNHPNMKLYCLFPRLTVKSDILMKSIPLITASELSIVGDSLFVSLPHITPPHRSKLSAFLRLQTKKLSRQTLFFCSFSNEVAVMEEEEGG